MSELTPCNFCSLQSIRRQAKKDGKRVMLLPGWCGGTDVLVYPKDVNIRKVEGIQTVDHPNREKYLVAWMQKIGNSCLC